MADENIQIKIEPWKLKTIAWLESLRWKNQEVKKTFESSYYCDNELFKLEFDDEGNIKVHNAETAEAILLTHYLVYICNRQMDYQDIFKAGAYTISDIVRDFIETRGKEGFNKETREQIRDLISRHTISVTKYKEDGTKDGKSSFYFFTKVDTENKEDKIYNHFKNIEYNFKTTDKTKGRYEFYTTNKLEEGLTAENIMHNENGKVYAKFSSRFMVVDILNIYKTLVYLCEKFNGSFAEFLKYALGCNDKKPKVWNDNPLYSLAYAFHRLTYQATPQVEGYSRDIRNILFGKNPDTEEDKETDKIIGSRTNKESEKYLTKGETKESEEIWKIDNKDIKDDYSFENKKYDSKRAWCVARDFAYFPAFVSCVNKLLGEIINDEWLEEHAGELELPGDVWNNNLKFAKCFWLNKKESDKKPTSIAKSSKFVRNIYENDKKRKNYKIVPEYGWQNANNWIKNKDGKPLKCYPHSFDITFSFVPNMCSSDNCNDCPFQPEKDKPEDKKGKDFAQSEMCHKQQGKLCTFVLHATGLKYKCPGEDDGCDLLKILSEENKKPNRL